MENQVSKRKVSVKVPVITVLICEQVREGKNPPAAWLLLFSLLSGALELEKKFESLSEKISKNFVAVSAEKC